MYNIRLFLFYNEPQCPAVPNGVCAYQEFMSCSICMETLIRITFIHILLRVSFLLLSLFVRVSTTFHIRNNSQCSPSISIDSSSVKTIPNDTKDFSLKHETSSEVIANK